jgi:hypothetical protein
VRYELDTVSTATSSQYLAVNCEPIVKAVSQLYRPLRPVTGIVLLFLTLMISHGNFYHENNKRYLV